MEDYVRYHRFKSWGSLVVGLLVIANAYWGFLTWDYFIGGLLALFGLIKLLIPVKRRRR